MSVQLLKIRAKSTPDKMLQAARDFLVANGYKGSFGDPGFIAEFYTGMALQMEKDVDQYMAGADAEDLEYMEKDHEISCLKNALDDLDGN
jgi:hypothetical protein